jgi:transglutaminase-like putative cysteine protease
VTWRRCVPAIWLILTGLIQCGFTASAQNRIMFDQVTSTWTVASDGTWVTDSEISLRAPRDNPSHVVQVPLIWSGSAETLQVVQARIEKSDGQTIVLGAEAVREDPLTGDEYFHEFSDQRRLIVTFSDAQTGDLLVIHSRRDVTHPRVPNGFMTTVLLDPAIGWTDVNYTINVPGDMPLQVETKGFVHESEVIKDRTLHYFRLQKDLKPSRAPSVQSDYDRLPRFVASTFKDWNEFARDYASVLLPHAVVTPAISAMAAKVTEGRQSPREQARLLYEWVRDTIRVIPISLEQSRRDPDDAEQVMTKLYGDTRDHAILLYALLAARNISAEMVLLNAADSATVAEPPSLAPMNHLILFLPRFDAYLDSTTGVAQFGVLPFQELGKPAIHLGGSGPARGTIPIPPSKETEVNLKTEANLDANGEVTGTTVTTASGAFGVGLRGFVRSFGNGPGARVNAATVLLRQRGTPGTGEFFFDWPGTAAHDYTVRGTFHLQNKSALLHGGFFSPWSGLRILPRPGDVLSGPIAIRDLPATQPSFCFPGVQHEELNLTIPEGRNFSTLPDDNEIDTDMVHFRSHWALAGRRITVTREFESIAPGPVCDGPTRVAMAAVLTKIRADLGNLVGLEVDNLAPHPITMPAADPGEDLGTQDP